MIKYAEILRNGTANEYQQYKVNLISNVTLKPMFGDYLKWYGKELSLDIIATYYSINEYISQREENVVDLNIALYIDNPLLNSNLSKCDLNVLASNLELDNHQFILIMNEDISLTYGYKITLDKLVHRVGSDNFYNFRTWYAYDAPLSEAACDILAKEICLYVRSVTGKAKKCIILDCDNVLWGGEAGELGYNGIVVGGQYSGRAYIDFQRELICLYEKGIIICLCSKNRQETVLQILENYPDMVLRLEHIADYRINWLNKADNIKSLINQLNISADSILFVDDSKYECELVKKELPEVETLHLEADKPHKYAQIIRDCRYFGCLFTGSGAQRTKFYREESKRKLARQSFTDIESYHKLLDARVELKLANSSSNIIIRLEELSSRVNQFNLTAKRYTRRELQDLIDNQQSEVLYMRASDIYGDLGIIGVAVLKFGETSAVIEAFMISCRVFFRDFEKCLLRYTIYRSAKRGFNKVVGEIKETAKNAPFVNFYSENGFSFENNKYSYNISTIPNYPSIYKVIED